MCSPGKPVKERGEQGKTVRGAKLQWTLGKVPGAAWSWEKLGSINYTWAFVLHQEAGELGFHAPRPQLAAAGCLGHFLLSADQQSGSRSLRAVSEEGRRAKQLEAQHIEAREGHTEHVKGTQRNLNGPIALGLQWYCTVSPSPSKPPSLSDLYSVRWWPCNKWVLTQATLASLALFPDTGKLTWLFLPKALLLSWYRYL